MVTRAPGVANKDLKEVQNDKGSLGRYILETLTSSFDKKELQKKLWRWYLGGLADIEVLEITKFVQCCSFRVIRFHTLSFSQ